MRAAGLHTRSVFRFGTLLGLSFSLRKIGPPPSVPVRRKGELLRGVRKGPKLYQCSFPSCIHRLHPQSPLGELQSKSLTFLKATTVDRVTGALGGMSSVWEVCSPAYSWPSTPFLQYVLCHLPAWSGSLLSLCPSSSGKDSDTPRGETGGGGNKLR